MHVQRPALAWMLPATALCFLQGCGFEPTHDDLKFTLSDATVQKLEEENLTYLAPHLAGALELYFGTPQQPAFLQPEDWVDENYNPNYPTYPADEDGGGEFTEEQLEAIYADNKKAFARELRLINDGEYRRIKGFATAPSVDEYWHELVARLEGSGEEALSEEEFKEQTSEMLIKFYPSLRDSAEMYRQQCLHCHGVSGGGDGPTAEFLNPLPRDYRKGVFKFTAVKDKARPRRADLLRILKQGVKGTAMPPFQRFSEAELNGLADYVRLLAIRGEVEQLTVVEMADRGKLIPSILEESYLDVWSAWQKADDSFFYFEGGELPEMTPELIARGAEVFANATTGNCASCHGEKGQGDGPAAFVSEENANGDLIKVIGDDGRFVSAYSDDWGHPIYPRNLTQGIYRGGGRPIDIYRRIYAGINGTPMPAVGESKTPDGDLVVPPEDMWALVYYVISLSDGADARTGFETAEHTAAANVSHDKASDEEGGH